VKQLQFPDTNAVSVPVHDQPSPAPQPVRVQNLLRVCAGVQTSLHELVNNTHAPDWNVPAPPPLRCFSQRGRLGGGSTTPPVEVSEQIAPLLVRICAHAAQVEQICARRDYTPAALPTQSRRAYQWLKFLSVPENLLAQLATMAEAQRIIGGMHWLREGEFARYAITFELSYGSYLYHTRPAARTPLVSGSPSGRDGAAVVRISAAQGFSGAPAEVLEALIKASLSRRQRKAREIVTAYVSGEDYAETALGFELAAELPQPDVRGRCHDLAQSFARVNAAYFAGELTPPRLTWSRTITKRLMGYYLAERDTLMLSLTLDRADVPAHIVDFVMYHELLHRVLGVPLIDGRRRPHGRAYREAERKFEGYAEADAFLKRLAQSSHQKKRR
jgi:hypothetical protein